MCHTVTLFLAMTFIATANAGLLNLWVTPQGTGPGTPGTVPDDGQIGYELWAEVQPGDIWTGISFILSGGSASLVNDDFIFDGSGVMRWEEPASTLSGSNLNLLGENEAGLGSSQDDIKSGDYFLLGTIDATSDFGTAVGAAGFQRRGANLGDDTITIGDTDLLSDDSSTVATLWTPEPASLALLALGALSMRRR